MYIYTYAPDKTDIATAISDSHIPLWGVCEPWSATDVSTQLCHLPEALSSSLPVGEQLTV